MKLQGYVKTALILLIVTTLSSKGPLKTSNVFLLNSGSSSKNNTPLCAKQISPGFGILPPPTRDIGDIVWCGALYGLVVMSGVFF